MKGKYALNVFMLLLPLIFISYSYEPANAVTVTERSETAVRSTGGLISASALKEEDKKEYTIMVYMNGSDLESKYKAATNDLIEMAHSNFNCKNINLIILTGGCKKWHTDGIPNNLNAIFQLKNKELIKLAEAGDASMGEPYLLAGFIDFAQRNFPALKYGLIMWNHGGGAVVGYGADERYENIPDKAVMKLTDIDAALYSSGLGAKMEKLEFLGFDTCLMSTVEMAYIASKYAKYLIASEEVEPEDGWDYSFLGAITPGMDGAVIGQTIVDYYGNYYDKTNLEDFSTLSLTNLSEIDDVVAAFENLSLAAGGALNDGRYNIISRARSRTRSFGSGGEDGDTDMVDMREMAEGLADIFPNETTALTEMLEKAVIHKYESREENTGGLSVYFPFYNKENLEDNIDIYKSLGQMPYYTDFISEFSTILTEKPAVGSQVKRGGTTVGGNSADSIKLTSEQIENLADIKMTMWQELDDGRKMQIGENTAVTIVEDGTVLFENKVFTLDGRLACLYYTNNNNRYSIPITLNGEDANIIVDKDGRQVNVLGVIPTNNGVYNTIDKKLISLKNGDKIAMRYYCVKFDENGEKTDTKEDERWVVGPEFYVRGSLSFIERTNKKYEEKLNIIDTQNNSHYISIGA